VCACSGYETPQHSAPTALNESERYEELENPTMLPAYIEITADDDDADDDDDDDDSGYTNPDLHYNSAYETIQ